MRSAGGIARCSGEADDRPYALRLPGSPPGGTQTTVTGRVDLKKGHGNAHASCCIALSKSASGKPRDTESVKAVCDGVVVSRPVWLIDIGRKGPSRTGTGTGGF